MFYIYAALIGLCVGSFLNVVIYRVPLKMSVAKPNSHCPVCKTPIKWYDNIPVFSYIFLGAKCRNCKTHIPFRYTAVEIANTLLWVLSAYCFFEKSIFYCILSMAVSSILLCIFFIDLENMIIPDRFQVMLLVLGILSIFCDKSVIVAEVGYLSHIIGGVAGFLSFLLISSVVSKIVGKEALGGGDIKLAGVMGLFLGWQKLLLALLSASVIATVIILIKSKNNGEKKEFPFGPFLSIGFALAMFFGDAIIRGYLSLFIM